MGEELKKDDPNVCGALAEWFKDWAHIALVIVSILFVITVALVVVRPQRGRY